MGLPLFWWTGGAPPPASLAPPHQVGRSSWRKEFAPPRQAGRCRPQAAEGRRRWLVNKRCCSCGRTSRARSMGLPWFWWTGGAPPPASLAPPHQVGRSFALVWWTGGAPPPASLAPPHHVG